MGRDDKRRKFDEAVLNMLYPPPPSPSREEDSDEYQSTSLGRVDLDDVPAEDAESSWKSEDDGEGECGQPKLTRAQRKRIRRKKLKEESAQRGKLIGPLLPLSFDGPDMSGNAAKVDPSIVRQNAEEESGTDEKGETVASPSLKRIKHRRTAKKLAKDCLKSSIAAEDE